MSITSKLILPPGYFVYDTRYTFHVNVENGAHKGSASYPVNLNRPPSKGTCTVSPSSGMALLDVFRITCNGFTDPNIPLTFLVLQEDEKRTILSDVLNTFTLILKSKDGGTTKLWIRAYDKFGAYEKTSVQIPLQKINMTNEELWKAAASPSHKLSISRLTRAGDIVSVMTILSHINDVYNGTTQQSEVISELLDQLTELELFTTAHVALVGHVFMDICLVIDLPYTISIKVARVLNIVTGTFKHILNVYNIEVIDEAEIFKAVEYLLTSVDRLVNPYDKLMKIQIEDPLEDFEDDYPDYDEFDVNVIDKFTNLQYTAAAIHSLLTILVETFTFIFNPDEPKISIKVGSIEMNTEIIDLVGINNMSFDSDRTDIKIHKNLIAELKKTYGPDIAFSYIFFGTKSPYWWVLHKYFNIRNVVEFSVFNSNIEKRFNPDGELDSSRRIPSFDATFDFFMLKDPYLQITNNLTVHLKNDMPVIQISLPLYAAVIISFELLPGQKIKVFAQRNKRPKHREVLANYTTFPTDKGKTSFLFNNLREYDLGEVDPSFIFMAVLPHKDAQTGGNTFMDIRYNISTLMCNTFDSVQVTWISSNCTVGELSNTSMIHCKCDHLSTFSSNIFSTPNMLSPPRALVTEIEFNKVILSFVCIFVGVYMIMMVWASFKDRQDTRKRKLIFLGTNNVYHSYSYLITVKTGIFADSTTTAKIGIQVFGSKTQSDKHILNQTDDIVFEKYGERSFLMRTVECLGDLTKIHLWSNCWGDKPNWNCNFVRVRDLHALEEWFFIVRDWLSLTKGDGSIFREIQSASHDELFNRTLICRNRLIFEMQESYLWLSIFKRHPRSVVNRKMRVTKGMCLLCFGLMLNILFYGRSTVENYEDEKEEYNRFTVKWNAVRIALQSLAGTIVFGIILGYVFAGNEPDGVTSEKNYQMKFRNVSNN